VKKAEDSDAAVIRFCEWNGKDTTATIKIFGREISCQIAHNELKTIDENGNEINIMEWEK